MASQQEIQSAFTAAGRAGGNVDYAMYADQNWTPDKVAADITRRFGASTATPTTPTDPNTPTTPTTPPVDPNAPPQVVAGTPIPGSQQINVGDLSGQAILDPGVMIRKDDPNTPENESMSLSYHLQPIDPNTPGTMLDPNNPNYQLDPRGNVAPLATTAEQQGQATTVDNINKAPVASYTAKTTIKDVEKKGMMSGAKGTVSQQAQITNTPQIDIAGAAAKLGLDDYAHLEIKDVEKEATLKGQLEILQKDFTGANGEPVIPMWAAGAARSVSRIAAFKGMTGTAATAAMAQAIMEASIPVAQQDAQFFQTLTLQNLSNKQQSILNKTQILAKFELANLDNRMAAAVTNAQSFLQMDLANLNNEQQARMINSQAIVQSILEDAKAVNTQRMFTADSTNKQNQFYDNLNASISMFTAAQQNQMEQFNIGERNNMAQFNVGEFNAMSRFNSEMENNREQFYRKMQFEVDTANANWRQTVTLQENAQQFEAASRDVQNLVDISREEMNQQWDRYDSMLDYLFTATENDLERKNKLAIERFRADAAEQAADAEGSGRLLNSFLQWGLDEASDIDLSRFLP